MILSVALKKIIRLPQFPQFSIDPRVPLLTLYKQGRIWEFSCLEMLLRNIGLESLTLYSCAPCPLLRLEWSILNNIKETKGMELCFIHLLCHYFKFAFAFCRISIGIFGIFLFWLSIDNWLIESIIGSDWMSKLI